MNWPDHNARTANLSNACLLDYSGNVDLDRTRACAILLSHLLDGIDELTEAGHDESSVLSDHYTQLSSMFNHAVQTMYGTK